jgi:hypothetical protein
VQQQPPSGLDPLQDEEEPPASNKIVISEFAVVSNIEEYPNSEADESVTEPPSTRAPSPDGEESVNLPQPNVADELHLPTAVGRKRSYSFICDTEEDTAAPSSELQTTEPGVEPDPPSYLKRSDSIVKLKKREDSNLDVTDTTKLHHSKAAKGGRSRATARRNLLIERMKDGTLNVTEAERNRYEHDATDIDWGVEYEETTEAWKCICSGCGKGITMKQPLDLTRFREHKKRCKLPAGTFKQRRITSMFTRTAAQGKQEPGESLKRGKVSNATPAVDPALIRKPCVGLTPAHDSRVETYLKRSGAEGGGSRSRTKVAQAEFHGRAYGDLIPEEKQHVDLIRTHERAWTNQRAPTLAIYSTSCLKAVESPDNHAVCKHCSSLTSNETLRKALRRDEPAPANKRFNNVEYQGSIVGEIFVQSNGLSSILLPVCLP